MEDTVDIGLEAGVGIVGAPLGSSTGPDSGAGVFWPVPSLDVRGAALAFAVTIGEAGALCP